MTVQSKSFENGDSFTFQDKICDHQMNWEDWMTTMILKVNKDN